MATSTRYDLDRSHPRIGEALRDLALRAIAPAAVLWAAIVGFGFVLVGPWKSFDATETQVNSDMQSHRTSLLDTITMVWSHVGNTEYVIATCLLLVAIIWWRTKEWWFAVVPGIAISLQATVFVLATLVIGRPRPHVAHLDPAPPTSSYPSGHVGASTALYAALFLMAGRIENAAVRTLVRVVCVVLPILVTIARLYRGMHHPSDVVVGLINGVVCAALAWFWVRRKHGVEARAGR